MITVRRNLNSYNVQTDSYSSHFAAALADHIDDSGFAVAEVRQQRFTRTYLLIVCDNSNLGTDALRLAIENFNYPDL